MLTGSDQRSPALVTADSSGDAAAAVRLPAFTAVPAVVTFPPTEGSSAILTVREARRSTCANAGCATATLATQTRRQIRVMNGTLHHSGEAPERAMRIKPRLFFLALVGRLRRSHALQRRPTLRSAVWWLLRPVEDSSGTAPKGDLRRTHGRAPTSVSDPPRLDRRSITRCRQDRGR